MKKRIALFSTGRRIPRASFTKETKLKHLIPTIVDLEMWERAEKKQSAAAILKLERTPALAAFKDEEGT